MKGFDVKWRYRMLAEDETAIWKQILLATGDHP
jgi:hypothetical protein